MKRALPMAASALANDPPTLTERVAAELPAIWAQAGKGELRSYVRTQR